MPILKMKKVRLREVKKFTSSHPGIKGEKQRTGFIQSWNINLIPKSDFLLVNKVYPGKWIYCTIPVSVLWVIISLTGSLIESAVRSYLIKRPEGCEFAFSFLSFLGVNNKKRKQALEWTKWGKQGTNQALVTPKSVITSHYCIFKKLHSVCSSHCYSHFLGEFEQIIKGRARVKAKGRARVEARVFIL